MIYGVIPVGGEGKRLGLPFSKEVFPKMGIEHYEPMMHTIVEKMLEAGASEIVFVHGKELKQDIVKYYDDEIYQHICQKTVSFSGVLKDAYYSILPLDSDKILFGLPDTMFTGNPFIDSLLLKNIVCCAFYASDNSLKVDRLKTLNSNTVFDVKNVKTEQNSELFWGCLKFDAENILDMINSGLFDKTNEIGELINLYFKDPQNKSKVTISILSPNVYFLDVGTWKNLNKYCAENATK